MIKLIPGRFYECKETLIMEGDIYFQKLTRYRAATEKTFVTDTDSDFMVSEFVFGRYFNPTPYDGHGNPIPKEPEAEEPQDIEDNKTLADEAYELIGGDRLEEYGDMRRSFENIGKVWSVLLGIEVSAEKVALMMVGLKLVRENNKHKRDNLVDLIGYTALLGRLEGEE